MANTQNRRSWPKYVLSRNQWEAQNIGVCATGIVIRIYLYGFPDLREHGSDYTADCTTITSNPFASSQNMQWYQHIWWWGFKKRRSVDSISVHWFVQNAASVITVTCLLWSKGELCALKAFSFFKTRNSSKCLLQMELKHWALKVFGQVYQIKRVIQTSPQTISV